MKAGNNMSFITKADGQTTLQAERGKSVSPAGTTANFLSLLVCKTFVDFRFSSAGYLSSTFYKK